MKEWEKVKIGRYIKLQGGFAFQSKDFMEHGVPLLRISNITDSKISYNDIVFLPEEYTEKFISFRGGKNDIVIAMSGATTGKTAKITEKDMPILINQRVGRFIIEDKNRVHNDFLYYIVSYDLFKNEIVKDAIGGAQPNISSDKVENFEVLLPPYKEQQKIAEILTTVDTTIKKTEQIIEKYKKVKEGMMQDLFTRGIDENGNLRPSYDQAPHLYKETELGMIPKEWEITNIKDLFLKEPQYGASEEGKYFDGVNPRYLRITDITEDGNLSNDDLKCIDYNKANNYILEENDIVVARTGNTVGKSYIHKKKNGVLAFAGYLIRLKFNQNLCIPDYIFSYFHSPFYHHWIKNTTRIGAQPNVNSKEYSNMKIPYPNLEEQQRIQSEILRINNFIMKEEKYKIKLQKLKQGLMQDLLTGKVRVKV